MTEEDNLSLEKLDGYRGKESPKKDKFNPLIKHEILRAASTVTKFDAE